jgi:hypothetical protein
MQRLMFLTILILLALSACAPGADGTPVEPPVTETPAPVISPIPILTEPPSEDEPDAVRQARQFLADELGVAADMLQLVAYQGVDWRNTCLGVEIPGEMCAEAITPGYLVELAYAGEIYSVHTNLDGSSIRRPVADPSDVAVPPLLGFSSADCIIVEMSATEIAFAHCGEATHTLVWTTPEHPAQLLAWVETYAPFTTDTYLGQLALRGTGGNVATAAEQRMIAEWAQQRLNEARTGRSDLLEEPALTFLREGGFVGFCDRVEVYLTGYAKTIDCRTTEAVIPLTASQLESFYFFVDHFAPVDYTQTDPATADALTIAITLAGTGSTTAGEADLRAMAEFASSLLAQATFAAFAPPEVAEAEEALRGYFHALHRADYILASRYFGGDTEILASWNPDILNDLPAWLDRGCNQNGLMCLPVRSVVYNGPDPEGGYQFLVEFNHADGTLFAQGPCCGEFASGPATSSFPVRVLPSGDLWFVLDLPPYVP